MNLRRWLTAVASLALFLLMFAGSSFAQSSTTGTVTGVVKDPSGAVIPNAQIELKDNAKGTTTSTKSGANGAYTFSAVQPSNYTMTITATGFQSQSRTVEVPLGAPITLNVDMAVASGGTTVTVTEVAPLVQTQNGDAATSLSQQQISQIPNPGNDLSFVAQLAPGVVTNTQGGYGNLEAFGLPGTSNLFTVNGMDDNDPFLNLNNSGASNLLLGSNEMQEADVVTTGYSGNFGTFAGVNVNYVTKSGGNQFHGNALYFWNGKAMNANNWFNNATDSPKPFSNANQWAASIGGPIKKDKLFFFFNTEGLRVLIPVPQLTSVPSTQFEEATLAQLVTNGLSASLPYYCQGGIVTGCTGTAVPGSGNGIFNFYNASKNYANATNTIPNGGCAGGISNPNFGAAPLLPCALSLRQTPINLAKESQYAGRVDYNIGAHDQMFVRMQYDGGIQPTNTDPINPLFNTESYQPEYQGQLLETHVFGPTMTNQFLLAATWYSAIFQAANQAATLSAFPTTLLLNDGSLSNIGGINYAFPQGRNVTQIQFQDDVSKTRGNHTFKFGVKYHKNYVSDHDGGALTSGVEVPLSLDAFYNGGTDFANPVFPNFSILQQNFANAGTDLPIRIYELGGYVQDEWRFKPNFSVTGALRVEHASNPVCLTSCFSQLNGNLNTLGAAFAANPNLPYNQAIDASRRTALNGFQTLQWSPRISFAWQPFTGSTNMWTSNTVVRGGVGIFYDIFPGAVADNISQNSPLYNPFTVAFSNLSPNETFNPFGGTGNLFGDAAAANAQLTTTFFTGAGFCGAQDPPPPNCTNAPPNFAYTEAKTKAPQFQRWSLEVQKGFGANDSVTIGYEGNHGIHIPIFNNSQNAFGFQGLPAAPITPQFASVTQIVSAGVSNYNGITATYQHRFSNGRGIFQINYTVSHALDDVSNGGFFNFSNRGVLNPTNPNNYKGNYGNADYNVPQYLNANYVYNLPIRQLFGGHGNKYLVDGWQVSGTMFTRSGLPWSAVDPALTGVNNYNATLFPYTTGITNFTCSGEIHAGPNATQCYSPTANFIGVGGAETQFGSGLRNIFRGPRYFDTDMTIQKTTQIPGWEAGKLGMALQFFNLFNHPNFNLPVNNTLSGLFGTIQSTVSTPTSILGSFLGGDADPRLIQLKLSLTF